MIYPLVQANQADYAVRDLCTILGVSSSGYYAWVKHVPSERSKMNSRLMEEIGAIHRASNESYGEPRITAELRASGWRVNPKRVARLMREAPIQGISRRRKRCVTTQRDRQARPAPDLVKRQFVASAPNRLWVADMTYLPTWQGFLYLAIILDVYSRQVVGWAFAETMEASLMVTALNQAYQARRPTEVIHHSDQGSQYTSLLFGQRCRAFGIQRSMGSRGDAYDNAMAESFFASLECELIDRNCWRTRAEARIAVFRWIEGWYNPRRRHSALAYLSPQEFEHHYLQQQAGLTRLPTARYAPRDNRALGQEKARPGYPQASAVDNLPVVDNLPIGIG